MKDAQENKWSAISESELEVMKVLWQHTKPLTSGEIVADLTEKSAWKPKTIQTMINRLVAKGVVAAERKDGKNYVYHARIAEDEYKLQASERFLDRLYEGSMNMLVTQFVQQKKLSLEEKEALRRLLEEDE